MLDTGFLPPGQKGVIQTFPGKTTTTGLQWEVWNKPRGITMLYMLCIGGGGGGGGGFTRAASAAGGGGGGGGSSGHASLIIPAYLVPDTLYIQSGVGGQGVASGGGTAGSGILSMIAIDSRINALNVLLQSGAVAAAGGGTGTGAAVGAAGAASTIAGVANMPLIGLGIWTATGGQAGVAGGAVAGAVGGSVSLVSTGIVTTGGAGGAGTKSGTFAGGGFTASANVWLSDRRPIAPAAGSNNGSGGFCTNQPFFNFGGCGGSSINASSGGSGGNGAWGSGGGGGGAGTTGGRGGNGGPGLVVITGW